MIFQVKVDISALEARTDREIRRLGFNVALAINETTKAVQVAERVNLDRRLTLRVTGFMYRLIKISTFASARQNRPFAEIEIDRTKQRILLGKLERGGVKEPERGKSVGVPITGTARPSFPGQVTPELRIGRLRFQQKRTRTGKTQWKGRKKAFIIRGLGILQRISSTAVRVLYIFKKDPRLPAILHFFDVAIETAIKEWPEQFRKAYIKK